MARPKRAGLEYFPLDVGAGLDDEIELIEAAYGLEGFAIFIKLLQSVYKNGYYINWTKKEQLIFTKRVNAAETLVNEVINACLEWELFNKKVYEEHNVLTSHGIQQRFLLAIGRRTAVEIQKEYLLLSKSEVSATKNLVIVTKTGVNVDNNPQSKVKESKKKVKEIESSSKKENVSTAAAPEEGANNIQKISRTIENTFGRLASPYEVELLNGYLVDGLEIELIEKALTETIENGVRNMKYTKSILERCIKEQIFTLDKYLIDQNDRKGRKEGEANGEGGNSNEIVRSEAELIQLRRAGELAGAREDDEDIPF